MRRLRFSRDTRVDHLGDGNWVAACRRDQLVEGTGRPVVVNGLSLTAFLVEGQVFAVGSQCAHRDFPIDQGMVADGCVICPWHGWRFDLATGDHLTSFGPRRGLTTYPAAVINNTVWVDSTASAPSTHSTSRLLPPLQG